MVPEGPRRACRGRVLQSLGRDGGGFSSSGVEESDLALLVLMPAAIAEISFMVWLAVKGANVQGHDQPVLAAA